MAQDAGLPKAADKGKGKAVDEPKTDSSINGKKDDDKKKDGRCLVVVCNSVPFANIATATAEEELSEEDQQLKGELDMIVERLTVRIYHIHSIAKR